MTKITHSKLSTPPYYRMVGYLHTTVWWGNNNFLGKDDAFSSIWRRRDHTWTGV